MDFLIETGLVKSSLNCDKCGGKMTLRMKKGISDNAVWACRCVIERKACEAQVFKA